MKKNWWKESVVYQIYPRSFNNKALLASKNNFQPYFDDVPGKVSTT